jgi:hypothetical protein
MQLEAAKIAAEFTKYSLLCLLPLVRRTQAQTFSAAVSLGTLFSRCVGFSLSLYALRQTFFPIFSMGGTRQLFQSTPVGSENRAPTE